MLASDTLADLATPCLVLDEATMLRNIARLRERLSPLGAALRPHLKTARSVAVARRVLSGGDGPATVSTLKEAERQGTAYPIRQGEEASGWTSTPHQSAVL